VIAIKGVDFWRPFFVIEKSKGEARSLDGFLGSGFIVVGRADSFVAKDFWPGFRLAVIFNFLVRCVMVANTDVGVMGRDRFAQLAKAGLPFNPVGGNEIVGRNVDRLLAGMKLFGWADPRFVTQEQAQANDWVVGEQAQNVVVKVRGTAGLPIHDELLFNAVDVLGMPPMAAMLAMSDAEIAVMQGREVEDELTVGPAREVKQEAGRDAIVLRRKAIAARLESFPRVFGGPGYGAIENTFHSLMAVSTNTLPEVDAKDIVAGDVAALRSISDQDERHFAALMMGINAKDQGVYAAELLHQAPDIAQEITEAELDQERQAVVTEALPRVAVDLDKIQPIGVSLRDSRVRLAKDAELAAAAVAPKIAEAGSEAKFGVKADYWQNGLHNSKGVSLAKEINKTIKNGGLEADKEAIARLLAVYPDARRLGINVVTEARLLADLDLRANVAEPRTLLKGALVRDKEGAYRPAAGGLAVVMDKGDSLSLKGKSTQGYQAAMELAVSKGWTAIELKGKPAMLANAWLEAKMLGLDVVNYAPTEKDKAAFAQRVAEESKANAPVVQVRPAEVVSENVEVRPAVVPEVAAEAAVPPEKTQAPEVAVPAQAVAEVVRETVATSEYLGADGLTKTASVTATMTAPEARPAVRPQSAEPAYGELDTGAKKTGVIPMDPLPSMEAIAPEKPSAEIATDRQRFESIRKFYNQYPHIETDELSAEHAKKVVASNLEQLRAIQNPEVKKLALDNMKDIAVSQKNYVSELTARDPNLGAEFAKAYEARRAEERALHEEWDARGRQEAVESLRQSSAMQPYADLKVNKQEELSKDQASGLLDTNLQQLAHKQDPAARETHLREMAHIASEQKEYLTVLHSRAPDIVAEVIKVGQKENSAIARDDQQHSNDNMARMVDTIAQTQWAGMLVEHGAAPFNHERNNKLSYFAVLENEEGKREVKWGVDLDRSLTVAGAKVGDVVSLVRGELTPVTVDEKQLDGSVVPKSANRVTWETAILSRAIDVAGHGQLGSLAPAKEVAAAGLHVGKIVEIVDGFAKQQTGRDPVNDVKWHELSKMDGPALEVGKLAEIQYAGGMGKVKGPELERAGIGR